ncbi:universal stress protein [Microbacterium trichothecenolyticum]|uniref:Universal stress protein n=1 Tax=Microbacterium trichothecenolyticum TaxID=69370 RepID=A0A0M2H3J7_MICTR|nr:universal stress protein [Microbacterium trichothecenolyticum]KJL40813.1 Universal stress protein [Microbacterium trichothecenolyticum]
MADAIVAGVTGRPVRQRVADWAAGRAAATGRDLVLVSVVGGAVGAVGEDEVLQRALDDAQALADGEVARLQGADLDVRTVVSHGNPTEVLIEQSADAALLVIGSDLGGEGHVRRGPHGRRIVAGAHCTVIVVPDLDLSDRRGVVVGVDGSDVSQRALEFAAAEAAASGDALTAVSAWIPVSAGADYAMGGSVSFHPDLYLTDLQAQTERSLDELLADVRRTHPDLRIETYVAEGDPGSVINEVAATARLAVVGTHGRTGLARLLLGSVSEHVLAELVTITAVVR